MDLSAESAETQIFVVGKHLFRRGAPNAKVKNQLPQARSFTTANFLLARHFTLHFRYAKGMKAFQPMNSHEDSHYAK